MSSFRVPLPALLLVPALVLLPVGRMLEIPLGLLAIAGFLFLLRSKHLLGASHAPVLLGLLASFTLPMLLSLPDAIAPQKSLFSTLGTLRYGLCCAALLYWYQSTAEQPSERDYLLRILGLTVAVLLTLWCLDGLYQFVTGHNILGYGVGEGYINGMFGDDDNIKFGIAVAFLLPIGLVYALRAWPGVAVGGFLLLVVTLVVLSGKRAAWISVLVELSALGIYYFFRGRLGLLRVASFLGVTVFALVFAYSSSDWVRERSVVIVAALDEPDYATVNRATGLRLPIWRTAVAMGEAHWINGVGPRGFRYA
ncbi:MAG: O-antigen ligase family protein, partial [Congregibacter sp.]|nr:O-antigen ligase family protein [Congregibacter sp.]